MNIYEIIIFGYFAVLGLCFQIISLIALISLKLGSRGKGAYRSFPLEDE